MKKIISNIDCPFILDIMPGDNAIQTSIIRVCIQDQLHFQNVADIVVYICQSFIIIAKKNNFNGY